ncbi:MAG TPA: hypothetical protein VLA91_15780 [Acidimicrobiia bacterium]|nr:hypothetical protein [Acidimicrobiia bacterium]
MTPNVVEDARESHDRVPPARPRWTWLLVGLVIGAGAAFLMIGVDPPVPSPVSSDTGPGVGPSVGGIADAVEGFPDGLMAVTRSNGQSLELMIWPLQGEPHERAIPVGVARPPGPVDFDHSGRRIATLLPMPETELGVLYAGIPENAEIVATGVTGYAWHDSVPYVLAYTTFADDELFLWVMRPGSREPELAARAVGIDGSVSAWGDWGYVVQDRIGEGAILFTPSGEIKDSHPGRILTSYRTGWLAVDNEGLELLSSGGGVRGLGRGGLNDEVLAGRFSDDGEKLALLISDGVLVFSLDDDSVLLESGGRPGLPQLAWSSDGRFVIYPGERGVWAIDTVDGDFEAVLTDRVFTGLSTTPIGGS